VVHGAGAAACGGVAGVAAGGHEEQDPGEDEHRPQAHDPIVADACVPVTNVV
jgi:hypothetical protein